MDRHRWKNNLIIKNLAKEEDKNDKELIEAMLEKVIDKEEDLRISDGGRLGRPEANLVGINNHCKFWTQMEVTKPAHKLKDLEGFCQVYISPNLTIEQQKSDRVLRGKLKELRNTERHKNVQLKIRRGQVIQIADGGRSQNPSPSQAELNLYILDDKQVQNQNNNVQNSYVLNTGAISQSPRDRKSVV